MTSTLDYVTNYAERKWSIFPCKPRDKTPLVKWQAEATADAFQITEWWSKWPTANVGLATGRRSGLFALDVDAAHGGIETLAKLTEKYGELPHTPTNNTGGGGHHYLFSMPEYEVRNSAGKLGAGLDTRGEGGYIVIPPSIHPSGKSYEWDKQGLPSKVQIATAPDWLIKMIAEEVPANVTKTMADGVLAAGGRNSALTSLAGAMQRKGMSKDAILSALMVENTARCVPPLPADEVCAIAESVSRYPAQAAPLYQSRDRVTAEWSFCKTIYEFPDYYVEHLNIAPEMFTDKKLREYWQDVRGGMGVAQAASNAGILTDIEKYSEWFFPRLKEYSDIIAHHAKMDTYNLHAFRIQEGAKTGDVEKIDRAVNELLRIPAVTGHVVTSITDIADDVEREIHIRAQNPVEVWGIPYAYKKLSVYTGGKQRGELQLLAGEPKIGKSYWKLQDVLQTAITDTPVFYWCGEMRRNQLVRRLYSLLGVNSRNMRTGNMTPGDWSALEDAKALILNSPLYLDDTPLKLFEVRPLIQRMVGEYGVQEVVIDYASKIHAPGKDEIEQSANITKEMKEICNELQISMTLIASVNKGGMDGAGSKKANVRGSGQQIHDADVIFQLTSFNEEYGTDYGILPVDYPRCVSLNITAGRELEGMIEGGMIPYMRELNSPKFVELTKK